MAETQQQPDPKSGFCSKTRTFQSLRPSVPLPPLSQPLSVTECTLSLLSQTPTASSPETTAFLIDASTGRQLSYSHFLAEFSSLTFMLKTQFPSLASGQVAFILSPPSLHVPVLYFSLISLGVAVSPANPLSTPAELAHQIRLSNPSIAFATSSAAQKLPPLPLGTILVDSPHFLSMINANSDLIKNQQKCSSSNSVNVNQSDTVAVLYSSGTTGKVKGVELTHRNLIAVICGYFHTKYGKDAAEAEPEPEPEKHPVTLFTVPLFHVFGFFMLFRSAALGETLVLMERFDFAKMLMAVEKYRVTYLPVSPPLVVAMAKSDLVAKYDLSSLELLACGGAPLGKEVADKLTARLPNVTVIQGFGMTEVGGSATRMVDEEEAKKHGSAGRLSANIEAKIVDPGTGEALPPGMQGELWLRGPTIMKGYIGDKEATAATVNSERWLKTGDLCYFDSEGFLYVVDRLKELIKYKAYQVPPAELEHLLQSFPEVADAAVIPYPDEEAGQIPMAYVVREPGSSITEAQIIDSIAKQVAPYKKIRRVAFINSIPKSPAGKILRRELVKLAISGASARL